MVDVIWASIAFLLGVCAYLAPAALAPSLPTAWHDSIVDHYWSHAMRTFEKVAIVERTLGGYDVLPISVDAARKQARVTLQGSIIGEDRELTFDDPLAAISRLYGKPLALVYEDLPSAVDAELCELAARDRVSQPAGEPATDGGADGIDPWVRLPSELRAVRPHKALALAPGGTTPETVESVRQFTKHRFTKYGSRVSKEQLALFFGFAAGIGAVALLTYVQGQLLDSGQVSAPEPPISVPTLLVDVVGVVA